MCFCKKNVLVYNNDRQFFAQNQSNQDVFPSNFIKTSHYNFLNFFPLSLLLQFKRYANIYFLATAVLQSISIISPLSPIVAIAPLIFVLSLSIIREGMEDYYRHKNDYQQNYEEKTIVLNPFSKKETQVAFAMINVGDILKIYQDQPLPADVIVLGSDLKGICYIETGALDGEKNLKPRQALKETSEVFTNEEFAKHKFQLQIFAKKPDQDPNKFEGSLRFDNLTMGENTRRQQSIKQIPLSIKQFLPRGCFIRNTEYIYGVVVYTGMDTKIMRNSETAKPKISDMEKKMNSFILCVLAFQIICAFIMSSCQYCWLLENYNIYPYLNLKKFSIPIYMESLLVFFSYFILFNTMIPISLIVSLEMVKVAQSYFIMQDQEMYSAHNKRMPRVLTSTINEELGQVEYIFSDKTGTLTQNLMQFKNAVIGNKQHGQITSQNQSITIKKMEEQIDRSQFIFKDQYLNDLLQGQNKENIKLNITLKSEDKTTFFKINNQYELTSEYFKVLALAHDCIISKNKDPKDTTISYQGPSPDEITLVDAAHNMGFSFVGNSNQYLYLKIKNQEQKFERIGSFEFTSTRKRMTIIIEDDGVYKMYVKGADSIIKARLDKSIGQPFLQYANKKLHDYSIVGLRTLLIGMKILSKTEIDNFKKLYNQLSHSNNREEELDKLADQLEQNFFLLGATAVEDKLQDEVPETIHDMLRANIKVWMLTGDKLETAENIAKSCRLIQNDFEILTLNASTPQDCKKEIQILWDRFKYCMDNNLRKCFLIEGETLTLVFNDKWLLQKFVSICKDCESVVCCRVSPAQKAQVVRTIKQQLKKITLAIGDGANDVNMIQEAHIGCGIYGNEGMRAVQSSDFALGQFKCLWRLLLVHGRWSYIRISEMIIYFFYKNMIFTIPQFFFAFYCGFSGQTIFDDWYISLYNLVFTALPLIVRAVFDQDINYLYFDLKTNIKQLSQEDQKQLDKIIENRKRYIKNKMPTLYYLGQKQSLFSTNIFIQWLIEGLIHGAIIFYWAFWSIGDQLFTQKGQTSTQWSFSLIVFTSVVLAADFKLAIFTRYWTSISYLALFGTSIIVYFAFLLFTEIVESSNVFSTPVDMVQSPHFYLVIFITVVSIYAFDKFIIAFSSLLKDESKELSLRKLMKIHPSQQKKDNYNSKWVIQSSYLKINSNLNSFFEKHDRTQLVLSDININSKFVRQKSDNIYQSFSSADERKDQTFQSPRGNMFHTKMSIDKFNVTQKKLIKN